MVHVKNEISPKVFCGNLQTRVVIFGMQVDDDVLYREIAHEHSPAYSSLF